jgi:hypothetical protein
LRFNRSAAKATGGAMPIIIEIPVSPTESDREEISKAFVAFNERTAGPANYAPLAINLRDEATGERLGGLWGQIYYVGSLSSFSMSPNGTAAKVSARDFSRKRRRLREKKVAEPCGLIRSVFKRLDFIESSVMSPSGP